MNTIQKIHLFRGFSSSIGPKIIYDLELVKQDLLNHFNTRKGERVMMPEFGSIIWELLFEPFTDFLITQITDDVKNIIASDPRLELTDLNVDSFEHGLTLNINLKYVPFDAVERMIINFDDRSKSVRFQTLH